MVELGARVDEADRKGNTPLIAAVGIMRQHQFTGGIVSGKPVCGPRGLSLMVCFSLIRQK